jgi:hypothetical protein
MVGTTGSAPHRVGFNVFLRLLRHCRLARPGSSRLMPTFVTPALFRRHSSGIGTLVIPDAVILEMLKGKLIPVDLPNSAPQGVFYGARTCYSLIVNILCSGFEIA